MNKIIILIVGACVFSLTGCVEKSQKYKALQARVDSLNMVSTAQQTEMDEVFAGLNDISAGMQSLREAENLLSVQADQEKKAGTKSKKQLEQLKRDVAAISDAIATYKEQIAKLEGKNKSQSAEFKKLIANLNAELEQRNQKITEITKELADKNQLLVAKGEEINSLNQNVEALSKETAGQKETIAKQDEAIHLANYLVGSRKELKEADVISRQGLFCPPIVSSQAQKANFVNIDIREQKSIPLNSKKAKILSAHPADSYLLEEGEGGVLTLKIKDENSFWKQTRYLVVMVG